MNLLKKLERNLTALALVPLVNLETKERNRRNNERMIRLDQKKDDKKKSN